MTKYIFKNIDASLDSVSMNIPIYYENYKEKKYLITIEFFWSGLSDSPDSKVEFYQGNNIYTGKKVYDFIPETTNNFDDSKLVQIYPYAKYLKLKYISNSVTSGKLTAIGYYSTILPNRQIFESPTIYESIGA